MEVSVQLYATIALQVGGRSLVTHWIRGWMGSGTDPGAVTKKKGSPMPLSVIESRSYSP